MSDLKTAALEYHTRPRPEKLSVKPTKPTATVRDLSLAYSPGIAESVCEIAHDAGLVYQYAGRGNLVAVISDGTTIPDLGNLGPPASRPVMEGKGVLFKRFAGIDVLDIETDAEGPQAFINAVKHIPITFSGVSLKDIKVPKCFEIKRTLIERYDIPVFHDDQYGIVIATAAGMLNILELAGKKLEKAKIVCLGAGTAAISCMRLLVGIGAKVENIYMIDRKGVIRADHDDLNRCKSMFAIKTDKRTLADAPGDTDVFVGLSGANLLEPEDLKRMTPNLIVLACLNPNPKIKSELAHVIRDDVIMATGRSDYPNQVNNVLGFPFIFRGALDVRAIRINEEIKIAVAPALCDLTEQPVSEDVYAAYDANKLEFGRRYIIPKPMDRRLITVVSDAVAKATIETGVAVLPHPKSYPLKPMDGISNG